MRKKSLSVKKIIHKKNLLKISDKKIINIYQRFKKNIVFLNDKSKFSAGISGGPDSMALAYFLKLYSLEKKIRINYYHVDHGLRHSSKYEALMVKKKLKLININLKILKWKGQKPKSNIQSKARKSRYDLINGKLNKNLINIIFLGHTEDDLIENFLIRLSRGSGLKGFVSFNSKLIKNNGIYLCRPLLNCSKSELEYTSQKIYNFYIKDPSNKDFKYKRSRIREIIQKLKEEKFNFEKIKLTISNLTKSNEVIEFYVNNNLDENTIYLKKKFVILKHNFFLQPDEIVFRSFSKILSVVGGKYYPSRGRKILKMIHRVESKNFSKATLSGCTIEKIKKLTIIYPETLKKL